MHIWIYFCFKAKMFFNRLNNTQTVFAAAPCEECTWRQNKQLARPDPHSGRVVCQCLNQGPSEIPLGLPSSSGGCMASRHRPCSGVASLNLYAQPGDRRSGANSAGSSSEFKIFRLRSSWAAERSSICLLNFSLYFWHISSAVTTLAPQ